MQLIYRGIWFREIIKIKYHKKHDCLKRLNNKKERKKKNPCIASLLYFLWNRKNIWSYFVVVVSYFHIIKAKLPTKWLFCRKIHIISYNIEKHNVVLVKERTRFFHVILTPLRSIINTLLGSMSIQQQQQHSLREHNNFINLIIVIIMTFIRFLLCSS